MMPNAAIPDHYRDCVGVAVVDGVVDRAVSKKHDNRRRKWSIPMVLSGQHGWTRQPAWPIIGATRRAVSPDV
jgi:hypothetical protein